MFNTNTVFYNQIHGLISKPILFARRATLCVVIYNITEIKKCFTPDAKLAYYFIKRCCIDGKARVEY